MFDLIRALPGWLIQHWFIGTIALVVCLGLAYVGLLKTYFGVEDVRDIRRRRPK